VIVIRRLSIRAPAAQRAEATFLARQTGEVLARSVHGAQRLALRARLRIDGGRQPAPMLARTIASAAVRALDVGKG
jgi:hypothetical protein